MMRNTGEGNSGNKSLGILVFAGDVREGRIFYGKTVLWSCPFSSASSWLTLTNKELKKE